jgi:hypothetical protein
MTTAKTAGEALDPNESDPLVLWAEIARLQNEARGPHGFATWKDAAIDERVRRVKAQRTASAEPFDRAAWLFDNHWITYEMILLANKARDAAIKERT